MLTKSELEILELLSQGLSNKEIAEKRFNAEGTIKTHIIRIYKKLKVSGKHARIKAILRYKEMLRDERIY